MAAGSINRRTVYVAVIVLLAALAWLAWRAVRSRINLAGFLGTGAPVTLTAPAGFQVELFAKGLSNPRLLAVSPEGEIHVADREAGSVLALPDEDRDGRADDIRVVASGLDRPHSLAWHEGAWYVGVPTGVIRLDDRDGDGIAEGRTPIVDDVPSGGFHRTRTVAFLPDGRMVLAVGSSCNVCQEDDPRRAAIVVYPNASGGEGDIFARGLRNAVGLAIRPGTAELWATNNGRDLLGDDVPPETLNHVQQGQDFGWPRCINGRVEDPDEGGPGACDNIALPAVEFQAHSAPLGLSFYEGEGWPAEYQGDAFIANHGSWNRSEPTGYHIMRVPFEDGRPTGETEVFVQGWLARDGSVAGRPAGVVFGTDDALYISDDKAGLIYRVAPTP